jgi:hypothetical protein
MFIDWNDEVFLADTLSLPDQWRATQEALHELWERMETEDEYEGFGAFLEQARSLLPSSALLLELREPARGAGHWGSSCVICLDFDDQVPSDPGPSNG